MLMKKILLFVLLIASCQLAMAQKKTPTRPPTAFIYEVDAVKNLVDGEIDRSSCQVTRQPGKIIWKSDENTLVFIITKTTWKSKTHVEYVASQGNVDARWVFKEVKGEKQIAFFTDRVAMVMRVSDTYTKAL